MNKKLSSSVVTRAGGDPEAYKISQNISDMWSPLTRLNVFYCNFRRYLWGFVLSVWGSDVTTTKLEPEKNPSGDETRSKPTTLSSLSCSCKLSEYVIITSSTMLWWGIHADCTVIMANVKDPFIFLHQRLDDYPGIESGNCWNLSLLYSPWTIW